MKLITMAATQAYEKAHAYISDQIPAPIKETWAMIKEKCCNKKPPPPDEDEVKELTPE
jgi:hypothetical protein